MLSEWASVTIRANYGNRDGAINIDEAWTVFQVSIRNESFMNDSRLGDVLKLTENLFRRRQIVLFLFITEEAVCPMLKIQTGLALSVALIMRSFYKGV